MTTKATLVTPNQDSVMDETNDAIRVNVVASSATSSAGTEYSDGAARGTATGTLVMGDDGTDIQAVKVDSSGVLAVQDNGGSLSVDDGGGSITVDGSVTVSINQSGTANDVDVATITGTGSIANGQVSVTASSATLVAARSGRRSVLLVNHGTTDVYVGTGTVTTANGLLLTGTKGASVSVPTSAAINGIVAAGTQTISYIEVF